MTRRWVPSVRNWRSGAHEAGDRQPRVITALLPGDLAVLGGDVAKIVGNGMMIEAR